MEFLVFIMTIISAFNNNYAKDNSFNPADPIKKA